MSTIRAIKIPMMNPSGLKLKKTKRRSSTSQTSDERNVLQEVARFIQKKYKILPTWKGDLSDLFDQLKTRSESKCVVELLKLAKKSDKKAKKPVEVTSATVTKRTLFTKKKKKSTSTKQRSAEGSSAKKKDDDEVVETTITEVAQRSK